MAADETRQPRKQRVVELVKASKNWKGAYQADYNCPKCRAPLVSLDDTLLATETCPNCNADFIFGPAVQTEYRTHKAAIERKEEDKRRAAEERKQAAAQRRETQDRAAMEISQRKTAERGVTDRQRERELAAARAYLGYVEVGVGFLVLVSLLGGAVLVVAGIANLSSHNEQLGISLIVSGVTACASILLVYGLFRCLFAIHQILTDISAKLNQSRPKD